MIIELLEKKGYNYHTIQTLRTGYERFTQWKPI